MICPVCRFVRSFVGVFVSVLVRSFVSSQPATRGLLGRSAVSARRAAPCGRAALRAPGGGAALRALFLALSTRHYTTQYTTLHYTIIDHRAIGVYYFLSLTLSVCASVHPSVRLSRKNFKSILLFVS